MEKDRVQRYVESLERTIKSDYLYLKETIDDFRELCRMITPERSFPQGIVVDIRETYKEIRDRLTEIKAIEQLLQGKYRQYYHRDALRDKEILEIGFIAKNCFTKFEYTIKQKEALEKIKEAERARALKGEQKGLPFQWFRSKEHQVILVRNLRILGDLDYEIPSELKMEERREVAQEPRHLTLFIFKGDAGSLDRLYTQMRLREHDIMERYASDEVHGVLTHLREINTLTVEKLFLTFLEEFPRLKCLILPIHSSKGLEGDVLGLVKERLQEMAEGQVKTLSI
jgi:hypothetical protein